MKMPYFRRYLTNIDTQTARHVFTDVLVVGSGIAGLRAAVEAAEGCNVTVISKGSLTKSNTWAAQGGIAAVLNDDDTVSSHFRDTIKAGCGLCDEKIVSLIVNKTPKLVLQLKNWGTEFDETDGRIATTLEAGHSSNRIAHAYGDSTGRAIAETLINKARKNKHISLYENFYAIDLVTNESGKCTGVVGLNRRGDIEIIWANAVILATGGLGRLYRETTNPSVATGDGMAMAFRAGAILKDMELLQFHPTTLYIAGASRALVTEALRGEGGILLDQNGHRFMPDYDERAELAPRDVVSRSIVEHMHKTNTTHVLLDVRHFEKGFFAGRFPYIYGLLQNFDIDPERDLIPVRPSAHYMIGGIATDSSAATNIPGLYACGEAASTGLHGANRLASNSLAEGLVFGQIAGSMALRDSKKAAGKSPFFKFNYQVEQSDRSMLDTSDIKNSLRALMWRNVGISRKESILMETAEIISFWQRYVMDKVFDAPEEWECQNMLTNAMMMVDSALKRQESRGVHYREDFPCSRAEQCRHISISKDCIDCTKS